MAIFLRLQNIFKIFQIHSTPRQIVATSVNVHREYRRETNFKMADIVRTVYAEKVEERRETFFSDVGTDSESGSRISCIDLSSDATN